MHLANDINIFIKSYTIDHDHVFLSIIFRYESLIFEIRLPQVSEVSVRLEPIYTYTENCITLNWPFDPPCRPQSYAVRKNRFGHSYPEKQHLQVSDIVWKSIEGSDGQCTWQMTLIFSSNHIQSTTIMSSCQ